MKPALLLPYDGIDPDFAGSPVWCGRDSTVIGAVRVGRDAWIGDEGVLRADGQPVIVGDRFRLGHRSTIHIATQTHGTLVGDRVSVGRNSCVHACTVGSDVVIGDDVVILDGARVEDGVAIEDGAVVFPRAHLPGGFVYAGSPAKPVAPITPAEIGERAERMRAAASASDPAPTHDRAPDATAFVARTARLRGRISLGVGSTVLFCCWLDAGSGSIAVGADTNIQDNTVIRTGGEGLVVGRETTVGHNVRIADGRIGARCLIGIGARLAPGTVIADDVMLAAGATTEPGQLLGGGHLWGGRPARIIAPLNAERRALMAYIVESYCRHGREYRELGAALA